MKRLLLLFAIASPAAAQSVTLTNGTLLVGGDAALVANDTLFIGDHGTLNEDAGRVVSPVRTSPPRTLNAPSAVNVGGTGFIITSAQNLGQTTVVRIPSVQTGNGNPSIGRAYRVSAEFNSGLDATIVFTYDASEVNGLDENTLVLYRSTDGGTTWQEEGGTVDPVANTVTLTGVDAFSMWTAGEAGTLPVELLSFAGAVDGRDVLLRWTTASETNNAGFYVERSLGIGGDAGWAEAAFVAGRGTTTERTDYAHRVAGVEPGTHRFRLRQVDTDGAATLSDAVEVAVGMDAATLLTVGAADVRFAVRDGGAVRLAVYNVLGQNVATLFDGAVPGSDVQRVALPSRLSAGTYFVRLTAEGGASATARLVVR